MDLDARAFGHLEGEVKALHSMLLEQNKAMASMALQMDAMNKTLSEAKGGWKTLVWIGGMSASVGGLMTWLLSHIPFIK